MVDMQHFTPPEKLFRNLLYKSNYLSNFAFSHMPTEAKAIFFSISAFIILHSGLSAIFKFAILW